MGKHQLSCTGREHLHGSWIQIDQSHVSRNHYGWLYNNGLLAGYFNETETDELNGNTYVGVNDTKLISIPFLPLRKVRRWS